MADLDNLNYPSILDMPNDEAIDLLRQIRLSRRTSKKITKTPTANVKTAKVDSNMASELLKILGGSND